MTEPCQSLTVAAHAKINWTLDVGRRRDDGYHEIASVMQLINLHDLLTVRRIPCGIAIDVAGPCRDGAPADSSNLVWRAAQLLGADGVHLTIDKRIPSQAGLGGGSSDAAAALTAVNQLLDLRVDRRQLRRLASQLGSDVLFFLHGGSARVGGIGNVVESIAPIPPRRLILIKPPAGVPTRAAYNALDALPGRVPGEATGRWPSGGLSNDFEQVVYALYPAAAAARDALVAAGAQKTLLCGSGSTVMGVYGNMGLDETGIVNTQISVGVRQAVDRLKEQRLGEVWTAHTIL